MIHREKEFPFSWTCPYCGHKSVVTTANYSCELSALKINDNEECEVNQYHLHDKLCIFPEWILCPNTSCQKQTLIVTLIRFVQEMNNFEVVKQWNLLPGSMAKVYPEYIPEAIRNDYEEACAILEGSPKASATLARRCLQGMIRNFWKIDSKDSLFQEINAIKDKVDPDIWTAIDSLRKIGNIGAHMEKDIDKIVDVDVNEAESLIGLIEMLMEEWYIAEHKKKERISKIITIGHRKECERKG